MPRMYSLNISRWRTILALVTMKQILDEATQGNYAVGAFNVNNLEQIKGIMEASRQDEIPRYSSGQQGCPENMRGEDFLDI